MYTVRGDERKSYMALHQDPAEMSPSLSTSCDDNLIKDNFTRMNNRCNKQNK